MKKHLAPSRRARLEVTVALVAGVLAVLASVWPQWIEAFGVDPDRGDGSLEWALPIALGFVALVLALVARRHWRIDVAKAVVT